MSTTTERADAASVLYTDEVLNPEDFTMHFVVGVPGDFIEVLTAADFIGLFHEDDNLTEDIQMLFGPLEEIAGMQPLGINEDGFSDFYGDAS